MIPEAWTKASKCDTGSCVEVMWKKATRSIDSANCVEVRKVEAMIDETWRKATRSNNNGACTEVRRIDDEIQVRDSKNPGGSVLSFTPAEWDAFLDGAKKGEFDLA